jgi:hypothetical protein
MSWLEHHIQSEQAASHAEIMHRQGELEVAKKYYAVAAEAEVKALEALAPDETRTIGITAVSAAALWFKAKEFPQAKQVAYRWLSSQMLPMFAIVQLEEILKEILVVEASAVAV